MNRNEFENWMKDKAEEQQFLPSEDLWLKLQADLQKPAAGQKKAFFLPWMKIAASVLIILSLGVATTYFIKDNNQQENVIVVNKNQNNLPQQTNNTKQNALPETNTPAANNIAKVQPNANNQTNKFFVSADTYIKPQQNNNPLFKNKEEIVVPEIVQTNKAEQKNPVDILPGKEHKNYINNNRDKQPQQDANDPLYVKNDRGQQAINLGMSANVGKSSISDVAGYQVGVVGRGNISKRIFVEAGISVASNTVSYSNQHSFPGVEIGSDGLTNHANNTTTNVQANYSRNVISVGVTPSVGIKVTKKLALSTGGALYRNLNPSLELTNESDIENAALSRDIISTSQKVSNWDIGVTCNADYKVTKNLSFNINYRKGITDYLQKNNKYEKNSGVQLGLKYLFGK
jgi:hypothetical protein